MRLSHYLSVLLLWGPAWVRGAGGEAEGTGRGGSIKDHCPILQKPEHTEGSD